MIGDIILFFQKFWLQHVTCRHEYKTVYPKCDMVSPYQKCDKCGKFKSL